MEPDSLGRFIRERRQALGLSQRKLAARSAVSHSYLANLERGFDYATGRPTQPTVEMLRKIAQGLEVEPEQLLRLAASTSAKAHAHVPEITYPATYEEQALMKAAESERIYFSGFQEPEFWKRPPEARRHAFRYLEGLIDEARQVRHNR